MHPQSGAEGGAKVAVCEGDSQGSQPSDRASSVFARCQARPTRDIDLLAFGLADGDRIAEVFRAACSLDVPDGITFDHDTVSTVRRFSSRSTSASATQ